MTKPPLLIQGMHGMGDCLHQRAVVRHWMQTHDVWLETSWPSVYHDMPSLRFKRRHVALRTQTKNAQREIESFTGRDVPTAETLRVRYDARGVMSSASKTVLEAMCIATDTPFATADYRLPIPIEWTRRLADQFQSVIQQWRESGKPLMIYRPLVARPEWKGGEARNADPTAYAELLASIRDTFFVVSVADLEPGREWIVGPHFMADVELHKGELDFQMLAALFHIAHVIFTSSGFAAILGPAVGTPVINIVGGYENVGTHQTGERFVKFLGIGPRVGCSCFTSNCQQPCNKSIDLDAARSRVAKFVSEIRIQIADRRRALAEMFRPGEQPSAVQFSAPSVNSPHYQLYLQQVRSAARRNTEGKA